MPARIALALAASVAVALPVAGQRPGGAGPQSRPAARADAERLRNVQAYQRDFVPNAARLRREHEGKWLVIAHGVVLPRRGEELAPAATLVAADAAAKKSHPRTAHRFVIRIGSEGERTEFLGATGRTRVVGRKFLRAIGRVVVHSDGVLVKRKGMQVEVGVEVPEGGAWIGPSLSAPGAAKGRIESFIVATGFDGHATVETADARAAGLANWEIPGSLKLFQGYKMRDGAKPVAVCRRAWMQFRIEAIDATLHLPVAVRPGKPTKPWATKPWPTKPKKRREVAPVRRSEQG